MRAREEADGPQVRSPIEEIEDTVEQYKAGAKTYQELRALLDKFAGLPGLNEEGERLVLVDKQTGETRITTRRAALEGRSAANYILRNKTLDDYEVFYVPLDCPEGTVRKEMERWFQKEAGRGR